MDDDPSPRTPVFCQLADCCYHELDDRGKVWCRHMDKPMHLRVEPCPLYRLDWKKRREQMRGRVKKTLR